jgi:8-oxo-dGTP diphosphatase
MGYVLWYTGGMKLYIGTKALIVRNGQVLVIREAQYDEGTEEGKWDVPGGRIQPEKSLHEGLRREIREESGLEVVPGEVLGVFETFPVIKGEPCHIVRIYYRCTSAAGEVLIGSDHDAFEWIDPVAYTPRPFVSDIELLLEKIASKS